MTIGSDTKRKCSDDDSGGDTRRTKRFALSVPPRRKQHIGSPTSALSQGAKVEARRNYDNVTEEYSAFCRSSGVLNPINRTQTVYERRKNHYSARRVASTVRNDNSVQRAFGQTYFSEYHGSTPFTKYGSGPRTTTISDPEDSFAPATLKSDSPFVDHCSSQDERTAQIVQLNPDASTGKVSEWGKKGNAIHDWLATVVSIPRWHASLAQDDGTPSPKRQVPAGIIQQRTMTLYEEDDMTVFESEAFASLPPTPAYGVFGSTISIQVVEKRGRDLLRASGRELTTIPSDVSDSSEQELDAAVCESAVSIQMIDSNESFSQSGIKVVDPGSFASPTDLDVLDSAVTIEVVEERERMSRRDLFEAEMSPSYPESQEYSSHIPATISDNTTKKSEDEADVSLEVNHETTLPVLWPEDGNVSNDQLDSATCIDTIPKPGPGNDVKAIGTGWQVHPGQNRTPRRAPPPPELKIHSWLQKLEIPSFSVPPAAIPQREHCSPYVADGLATCAQELDALSQVSRERQLMNLPQSGAFVSSSYYWRADLSPLTPSPMLPG